MEYHVRRKVKLKSQDDGGGSDRCVLVWEWRLVWGPKLKIKIKKMTIKYPTLAETQFTHVVRTMWLKASPFADLVKVQEQQMDRNEDEKSAFDAILIG